MRPLVHDVDVTVNGRTYGIACPAGEETRLRQLAAYTDGRVNKLALQFSSAGVSVSESKLLVMALLTLADELAEANNRLAECEEQAGNGNVTKEEAELLTTRLQRLAGRINAIADRVTA
jgi:cell division protein ZapA